MSTKHDHKLYLQHRSTSEKISFNKGQRRFPFRGPKFVEGLNDCVEGFASVARGDIQFSSFADEIPKI